MKTSRFLLFVVTAFALQVSPFSHAAAPAMRSTSIPTIVSVEADKITVQNGIMKGMKVKNVDTNETSKQMNNVKTYKVDKFTEITINGNKVKLSDLKAGMEVRLTAGVDPSTATIIAAKADRSVMIPAH